ncbi:MAG TPA: DMT family transporter [Burkholderiaceae bacterium]|nr:DMT family transporter [Burkholderiaceae bacterium]
MSGAAPRAPGAGIGTVAPALFVVLWASGFVVARLAMPHAPPLGFLAVRFAATLVALAPLILAARAPWPDARTAGHLAVSGLLIHAAYLSGVWVAVSLGMSAGVSALIVNLQPVLTAVWMAASTERVAPRQWLGLALGFGGVALVVAHRIGTEGLAPSAIALCVGALLAITAGTLYQRRHAPAFDLRTGVFVQYAASLAAVAPLAAWLETPDFEPTAPLAIALGWSVAALSIGSVFLMFTLIRRGSATRVASLFYLVPPVTALQAWLLFDEPFGPTAAAGMALTAIGVALVVRR